MSITRQYTRLRIKGENTVSRIAMNDNRKSLVYSSPTLWD